MGLGPQILLKIAPIAFALDPTKKMTKLLTSLDTKEEIRDLSLNHWYDKGFSCGAANVKEGFSANKNMLISRAGSPGRLHFPSCPSITSTCCTEGSLKNIALNGELSYQTLTKWYGAFLPIARLMMQDLYQPKFMKMKPADTWNLECVGYTQRSTCEALYINIDKSVKAFSVYQSKWVKYMAKCYNQIQQLRTEINCAFCDPSNNLWIFKSRNTLIWNRKVVNDTIKACFNYDLLNEKIVRPVFLAYLAYAQQVNPTLPIDENILYKMELFQNPVSKCQEWAKRTQASSNSDFTGSLACLKFGFSKIRMAMKLGKNIKFDSHLVSYITNVVNTQATSEIMVKLENVLSPTLLPYDVSDTSGFPQRSTPETKLNRILENLDPASIKKMNDMQKNLHKKRAQPVPSVQALTIRPEWIFLISKNQKDGIDQSKYEDNKLPQVPIQEIVNSSGNLLKSWVTVIMAFGLLVTFCY